MPEQSIKATKDSLGHRLPLVLFFSFKKVYQLLIIRLSEELREKKASWGRGPRRLSGSQAGLARLITRPESTRLPAGGQARVVRGSEGEMCAYWQRTARAGKEAEVPDRGAHV